MLLTKRKADWLKALQEFKPQDILALQEHLPAHLAAGHPHPSGCEMLKLIIELDPKCLITRDSTGQCPLHIACANESDFAEQLVALVLEHAPETAFAQDHHGMLPIHHACLNNGIAAGSISGRLISVFSPACQVVDDYNRLPLDCALSCSSPGVGEIIKSVVRAFPAAARLLDKHGNNVLHRASLHLETNPQIPDIIQALHEMKIRPNAGGLCNYSGQLPLHIASASTSPLAARCIALLADAYIPGAWAQEAKGDTPLHIAIRARNLQSVQTLSFKSRDKAQHMQNYEGKFPLNLATSRPFREVICKKNQEGDVFTMTIVKSISYVWFFASVYNVVDKFSAGKTWMIEIQAGLLILYTILMIISTKFVGKSIEESGWVGRIAVCLVPTLKSLDGFLLIVPSVVITAFIELWINEEEMRGWNSAAMLTAPIYLAANSIMEDGSLYHALDVSPCTSYSEGAILFLFRLSEALSRISVLAMALMDGLHCHAAHDPTVQCQHRGCVLGDPACDECVCSIKEAIVIVLVSEFMFLLIFLRVTASQESAKGPNGVINMIENMQNYVKLCSCSLSNMIGVHETPPKTMITYLGLVQSETTFIGEVKLLDGMVILCCRAASNSALLIIFTVVSDKIDWWASEKTSMLLWIGIASVGTQILVAYARYLVWSGIETRVEHRLNLMSQRFNIFKNLSQKEEGHLTCTDQMKRLNSSIGELGKIIHMMMEREWRHNSIVEHEAEEPKEEKSGITRPPENTTDHMFNNAKRAKERNAGERNVLPVSIPEFARLETSGPASQSEDKVAEDGTEAGNDYSSTGQRDANSGSGKVDKKSGPMKLDLNMLMDAVMALERARLLHLDIPAQVAHLSTNLLKNITEVGKDFIEKQTKTDLLEDWQNQLELLKTSRGLYMEQLMPESTVQFDRSDGFMRLESMQVNASSFAQYLRRPWSVAEIQADLVFSWLLTDRRAWQIRNSLKSKNRNSVQTSTVKSREFKAPSAPQTFKAERISQMIADLLQIHRDQVHISLVTADPNDRGEDYDQSAAILVLGRSLNSLDSRTPEQLFNLLETAVMDAIAGPLLPHPLAHLVSLKISQLPASPFRQVPINPSLPAALQVTVKDAKAKLDISSLPWRTLQSTHDSSPMSLPHHLPNLHDSKSSLRPISELASRTPSLHASKVNESNSASDEIDVGKIGISEHEMIKQSSVEMASEASSTDASSTSRSDARRLFEHRDAARQLHSIEEGRATDQQQHDRKKQQQDRILITASPMSHISNTGAGKDRRVSGVATGQEGEWSGKDRRVSGAATGDERGVATGAAVSLHAVSLDAARLHAARHMQSRGESVSIISSSSRPSSLNALHSSSRVSAALVEVSREGLLQGALVSSRDIGGSGERGSVGVGRQRPRPRPPRPLRNTTSIAASPASAPNDSQEVSTHIAGSFIFVHPSNPDTRVRATEMHISKTKTRASSHMRQLHSQPATLLHHPQVGRYNGEADETDAADAVAVQQRPPPAAPALRGAARERSPHPHLLAFMSCE